MVPMMFSVGPVTNFLITSKAMVNLTMGMVIETMWHPKKDSAKQA